MRKSPARSKSATLPWRANGDDAELYRMRGDLLLRLPSPDGAEVERCFRTALTIGRKQGTRGFELRAGVSLARLLVNTAGATRPEIFSARFTAGSAEASTPKISTKRKRCSRRWMHSRLHF
jgi:hypothetical protein